VLNLATPGTVRSWLAPATAAGLVLTHLSQWLHVGIPMHVFLSVTRVLGLGIAAAAGVWLFKNVDRYGTLRAMGLTMLLVVVLGPVVQPWYLSWGLILLAPVATGRVRTVIVVFSIASAFLQLPGGRQLVVDLFNANPLTVAVALVACLGILTVPLTPFDGDQVLKRWRRRRGGSPDDASGDAALELAGA
jgi:hypothetical protein